jgi:hypothetical protein
MFTNVAIAIQLTKPVEPEIATKLRQGEVVRFYERTMSRAGTFQVLMVLTPSKAFVKTRDWARTLALSTEQQSALKLSLTSEEIRNLTSKKRANPMWPSAYDAPDQWLSYRIGGSICSWTNHDYENPGPRCALTQLIDALREQATPK